MSSPALTAAGWNSESRLSARRLAALLVRSFFLQGSWSFERMQSVGWTAALAGEGRRLAPGERAPAFLQRHLGYFNTNPVMASYLLGGVVRMEEEIRAGRLSEEDVARFKRGLSGPLAAWGDSFFWAGLRPFATVVGVVAALHFGAWGVLVYLVAYNSFHLYYRVHGLSEGYRWGPLIVSRLAQARVKTGASTLRLVGLFATGALVIVSALSTARATNPAVLGVMFLGAAAAFAVLRRRSGQGAWWGVAAIALGLLSAWTTAGR